MKKTIRRKTKKVSKKSGISDFLLGILVGLFLSLMLFSFCVYSISSDRKLDLANIFCGDLIISSGSIIDSIEFLETMGLATIRVYRMYGEKSYESVLFLNVLGNNTLLVYEFTGKVFYFGILQTINYYSDIFQNTSFSFNIDNKIESYYANVYEGFKIVRGSAQNYLQKFLPLSFPWPQNINIKLGMNFDNIFEIPLKGLKILEKGSESFVSNFSNNIKSNIFTINRQLDYLSANVYSVFLQLRGKIIH